MNPNENPGAGVDVHSSTPPPKKSSWLKWLLGCGCGCLLIVGIAVGVSIWMGYSFADQFKASVERGKMYEQKRAAAGDMHIFVNSPNKLSGKLAENYVDFSFSYPKTWTFDPSAGQLNSNNFAEIDYTENDYTHEHLSIGWFNGKFDDEASASARVNEIADKTIAKAFGTPKKQGEGYAKFGAYDCYRLLCTVNAKSTEGTIVQMWFSINLVKHPAKEKGVMALMYATSKSPDVRGINEVGVKGELPEIVDSFEFK